MDSQQTTEQKRTFCQTTLEYAAKSSGLRAHVVSQDEIRLVQTMDQKALTIDFNHVEEVLTRFDSEQKMFLQINFTSGKKIILTENLIGFKPVASAGLDSSKLPKVVTTSDLMSVFEALEESLIAANEDAREIDTLKQIFSSIVTGAESVGILCPNERDWLRCIPKARANA